MAEPDEQSLEIVVAGLLDLGAIHLDEVDHQELPGDQRREIEAERCDVGRQLGLGLLEGEEHPGLAVVGRAVDQELHREQRLAAARRTAYQRRSPAR